MPLPYCMHSSVIIARIGATTISTTSTARTTMASSSTPNVHTTSEAEATIKSTETLNGK